MAERDEVARPLRAPDAGDAGRGERVRLRQAVGGEQPYDLGRRREPPPRDRHPMRDRLGADVDHPRAALVVEVREPAHSGSTATSAPAGSTSTSAGTSMSTSARAIAATRWEPGPAIGCTS